ncbi:uncharacterized protein [Ptychodera flava]|uniref:uncharacterized protein n=1 Tax=Ptychodera flava TaxID=63121 RepID=UPI00396A636C
MFELAELHKGYFPHFFNTAENQEYIGPLPDAQYYGPDDHGYIHRRNQSVIALQWLEWLAYKKNVNIQHVYNGGEKKIDRYWLDGYDEANNTAYEMHGCYYHGCPRCYEDDDIVNTKLEKTMGDLYQCILDKMRFLRTNGFNVIEMWECDFKRDIHENQDLQEFIKSLDLQEPLYHRDALYGGRTNATRLYHECEGNEEIHYVDFTSLYPYVNKSCVDTKQQAPCEHSDDQRSFVGTWTTPDLAKALEKGYKVIKVFEVWHYRESEEYNRESQTGWLFNDYINTFLKLKQESSGWPSWCQMEDDQDRYICEYHEREGILLDKTKINRNPGQRALAKLMLNSMWGKFAQRNNFPQLQYIQEPAELFRLLTSEQHTVNNLSFVNDNMVAVQHSLRDEFVEGAVNTNVVIAAFTTAYARLKLYDLLEAIGERVLYFDTDSVIFVSKSDMYEPPLGDYLGDLTSELEPPGNYITKFVSGGAKNYAFCLAQPTGRETTLFVKSEGSP